MKDLTWKPLFSIQSGTMHWLPRQPIPKVLRAGTETDPLIRLTRQHGPRCSLRAAAVIVLTFVALTGAYSARAQSEPFLEQDFDSVYNHLIVRKTGSVVSMSRFENMATLTAVDLADPLLQVVPYTRTMFAALLFKPNPKSALMIGLGGGGFNRLFVTAFPEARLTTAELDPMIPQLAERYMGFRSSDRNRVVVSDGRRYLRHSNQLWDWILLDAYLARSQVPPHLKTLEFYRETLDKLTPDGVLVSNLHSGTRLFSSDVATLRAAFPQVVFFDVPGRGNVIAVAAKYAEPSLQRQLAGLSLANVVIVIQKYIDPERLRTDIIPESDLPQSRVGAILTDDLAPVEFLDGLRD